MSRNACVLVAQNDPFFFLNCKNFLSQYNIAAISVENNYQKLLDTIRIEQPDVVLLDAIVPPSNSVAVINSTKFLPDDSFKAPAFFVLSCINDSQIKRENLEAGAIEYILKPVDNYLILTRIFNFILSLKHQKTGADSFSAHYLAKKSPCAPENLECRICEILDKFKMPVKMNGYGYLTKAITYNVLNIPANISLTKQIYPMVARAFNSNVACIERSIRHIINTAWNNGENGGMVFYFGNKKPTNMQFISLVSKFITSEGKTRLASSF